MTPNEYPGNDDDREPLASDPDSVEDVREQIEEQEKELRANGHIASQDPEQSLVEGASSHDQEVDKNSEQFAETIRDAMGIVGMHNADHITRERLARADPEIIKHLTPETAESLYFDAFRKTHRLLGKRAITLSRVISHARSRKNQDTDLEKLQLIQRAQDIGHLYEYGIDADQLLQISNARVSKQQNINRLAFFLFDEPRLNKFNSAMMARTAEKGSVRVEKVVKMAQIILRFQLERIAHNKTSRQFGDKPERRWTSTDYEFHDLVVHRIGSNIAIGDLILQEMRSETIEDFMQEMGPYNSPGLQ
ncbi:MAG: hypothetical protein JWO96_747 [Candidatus Saccharibacteria bacterium]|nr:hypothetical protein [Candidatus Saccharibacteria bacterium]